MSIKDKVKKSLALCREGKCNECKYNNWIPEMCRKVLLGDAIEIINALDITYKKEEDYGND